MIIVAALGGVIFLRWQMDVRRVNRRSLNAQAPSPQQARQQRALVHFFSATCDQCRMAASLIERAQATLPGVYQVDMSILDGLLLRREYDEFYRVPVSQQLKIPAVFWKGHFACGEAAIRELLRDREQQGGE